MDYQSFLETKRTIAPATGFDVDRASINESLFAFQSDIVVWALARGRAALWCDCGMGKSVMQLEWARHVVDHTGGNVLILAPLAVSQQTVREGEKFGISVTHCRKQWDVMPGINITNYEMLQHFDLSQFVGVVLDESSILKSYSGSTRTAIIEACGRVPYRLACTATPAPNDYMELGNHAEFLGVMTRTEMLSMYFVHDGGDTSSWRLKGHAQSEYWKWLASWAVMLRKPSDLGYDDAGFDLPPLNLHHHTIEAVATTGALFALEAQTLTERRQARRDSLSERVAACVELVNASDEPWLIWCDLNDEGDALERAIPGAVQVAGRHDMEFKEWAMDAFSKGRIRVMVSKSSICGFGMNFQQCPNMAFVGLSDSYEGFYQSLRRIYRFGQERPVHCHIITSEAEGAVVANIERKEQDARRMADEMVKHMQDINTANIRGQERDQTLYMPMQPMRLPSWIVSEVFA